MSNIVLSQVTIDNELHLEKISTEAIANPFDVITNNIKRNMHSIVSNISNIVNQHGTTDLAISANEFQQAIAQNKPKAGNHIETKDIMVVVPVGFTGDYLGYTKVLSNQFKVMHSLIGDVIEPAHNLILKYIGKPETMSTVSNSDLNRVKFHSEDIESFKKKMNSYFDSKKQHQALPIGMLIRSGKEFDQLAIELSNSLLPWMLSSKWRDDVFKSYTQLQQSLDLLLVRIEQKPDQYQLNKLNAERLSKMINDVAVEIELSGAMFVYMNQLVTCAIVLQSKLHVNSQ